MCRKESIHEGQENIDYENYNRRVKDYETQDTSKEEMKKKAEEIENSKAKTELCSQRRLAAASG